MSDLIDRQMAIDTEGLDEQIRCEMCRNPIHTDRGCDGNCKYDEKLYERIMQILSERITPLSSAQPQRQPPTEDDYAYCAECNSVEMCRWYPLYGCQFRSLPSAQPEIIRCKDCYWWNKQEDSPQGRCSLHAIYPTGGWYCANGRRKEGKRL